MSSGLLLNRATHFRAGPVLLDMSTMKCMPDFQQETREHAGSGDAKGLCVDYEVWQDASASVQDFALRAALAGGVVSFVHAASGVQHKLKQDGLPCVLPEDKGMPSGSMQQPSYGESKENRSPGHCGIRQSVDDVSCLELD